jgi:hypothetical protein
LVPTKHHHIGHEKSTNTLHKHGEEARAGENHNEPTLHHLVHTELPQVEVQPANSARIRIMLAGTRMSEYEGIAIQTTKGLRSSHV